MTSSETSFPLFPLLTVKPEEGSLVTEETETGFVVTQSNKTLQEFCPAKIVQLVEEGEREPVIWREGSEGSEGSCGGSIGLSGFSGETTYTITLSETAKTFSAKNKLKEKIANRENIKINFDFFILG